MAQERKNATVKAATAVARCRNVRWERLMSDSWNN
jgi:hypothetical protein